MQVWTPSIVHVLYSQWKAFLMGKSTFIEELAMDPEERSHRENKNNIVQYLLNNEFWGQELNYTCHM